MSQLHDPFALECLAAVVEEGGFERAAARLHVTQSAVSQRLRSLEAQVGTVLLVRSRPLAPTAAGALLVRHAKQLRLLRADLGHDLHDLAGGQVADDALGERISVAINADSISTWALAALTPLMDSGIDIEVIADDQDFTHEWLRSGQVMGCVTSLAEPLRGCTVTALGAMRYVCVASSAYAALHAPQGLSPQNFRRLRFVSFDRKDDLPAEFVARHLGLGNVQLRQHHVPSSVGQVQAVRGGWGVSIVPLPLAQSGLDDASLVDLAPGTQWRMALYWHCWKMDSARLAAASKALIAQAGTALQQEDPL